MLSLTVRCIGQNADNVEVVKPLFDYQTCGLKTIKKRTFTITSLQYDSSGQIENKYSRTETDTDLYKSSMSNELIGVTTFPFFSSTDKTEIIDGKIKVISSLENIKYYLKDIVVTQKPDTQHIAKIEAKLLIHGVTIYGETTHEELYIAEFAKFGDCYFPKTIKYCPLNDTNYTRPRFIIDIKYKLK